MAPLNGAAAKPAKTAARRTASKPVVPVLPLNYPQRLPAAAKPVPAQPNGEALHDKTNSRDAPKQDEARADIRREGVQSSGRNTDAVASSTAPSTATLALASGVPTRASGEKVTDTPKTATIVPHHHLASPTPTRPPAHNNSAANNLRISDLSVHDYSAPGFPAAMVNRPTALHQHHASNGSLIFGHFHDSNASSPAPHSGASFPPPPPGMMPYPQSTRPVPVLDGYGRPMMVSPTIDGYPPSIVSHPGPPTPHSFHGSQSSIPAEEASFSSFHSLNGQNGFQTDPTTRGSVGHAHGVSMHMNNGPHLPGRSGFRADEEDLLAFLRHGPMGNDTFTDCVLEARFPNSPQIFDHPEYRHVPLFRAPAHRFILSRSPRLANRMKTLGTPANGMVYLDFQDDEYMRPDVFNCIFRSLYGWPFEVGTPLPSDLMPRDVKDDMKTTLSYVAAARYLQLGGVYSMAIHHATQLINWETIESVVAFVVPIATVYDKNRDFNASELLDPITAFVVNQIPRDFVLDVNAVDSGFTRLPATGPLPRNPNAPAIAHSTPSGAHSRQSSTTQPPSSQNQRGAASARLSQIRFGDMAPEDGNEDVAPSPAGAVLSPRPPSRNETILSRILLNLPFELLKRILEHSHLIKRLADDGNATHQKLINEIVAEREARRLASLKPSNKQLQVLHQELDKAARPLSGNQLGDFFVNNMGFREEIFMGDGPYLGRTWTGGSPRSNSS